MNIDKYEVKPKGDGHKIVVEELVAKRRNTYIFVDYLFENGNLHGATSSSMCPVSEEGYEERVENMRDYEWSALAHIYDEIETEESWDSWIDQQIRIEGPELILDMSYAYKYGDTVREKTLEEEGYKPEYVECIGGGRMFNTVKKTMDVIYDQELWAMCQEAEENGLENLL